MPYPNREPELSFPKSQQETQDPIAFLTPSSERRASALSRTFPALLFAVLVVAVYADPLFRRRNFGGRDLTAYNVPMEKSIHDSYARGRLPVWSPDVSGGRPLLPNPNAGALYPVRPLLSIVPFPFAMRLFPVLHWIAAGIGMLLLLGALGASRPAAWVGAVTYAFSGVAVSEVFFPHIQPGMMLLPWIVWAVPGAAAGLRFRRLLLAALFGLLCLAGDVFTIGVALLASVVWILREEPRRDRLRAVTIVLASLGLGALLALPQILATVLWVPETNRAILGMKLRDSLSYTLSPFRLFEVAVPFPFGSTFSLEDARIWGWTVFQSRPAGLFATLYAGSLAAMALLLRRGSSVRGARFAQTLFVVALLLSVVPSLFPESWGDLPSPIPLRNPEKFAVALTFAAAVLAGLAFDHFRRERPGRWALAVAGAFVLLAVAAALFPGPFGRAATAFVGEDARLSDRASRSLAPALAEAGLLWCATLVALDLARRSGRRALLASLAIVTLVPIVANRRIAPTFRQEEVLGPTAFARLLDRRDPDRSWRTLGESVYRNTSPLELWISRTDPFYIELPRRNWSEHSQVVWNRGTVLNYDFDWGDLSRLQTLRRVSQFAARHSRGEAFFGSLALRWGVRFRDQPPLPGYRRFGGDMLQDWDENASALPDVRLTSAWREVPNGLAALNEIGRLDPGQLVIETDAARSGSASGGHVRILEKSPERLRLETSAPEATWLFVLRGFWSHRTVTVDGQEVEVRPAQIAFSAVPVPAGLHRVDWQEGVPGVSLSRWGPVLFAVAALALVVRSRR